MTLGGSCRDHPRIRGEHLGYAQRIGDAIGSSPHTRGARRRPGRPRRSAGIIPAYAGSTRILPAGQTLPGGSSPHTRGARGPGPSRGPGRGGSSPHTRGARRYARGCPARRRIIPAYAGSTDGLKWLTSKLTDHPRIRGEHLTTATAAEKTAGSSPHTRGAQIRPLPRYVQHGIIPAYAGSTHERAGRTHPRRDHPRIRGEHGWPAHHIKSSMGSSPHTRGALPYRFGDLADHGIIPAYAGSTLGNPCNTKDRRRDYTSFPLPVTHPSGGGGA